MSKHYMSRNIRKRTLGHIRTEKIQINLRICAARSEPSLCALKIANDAEFFNGDSDQPARIRRLI